MDCQRTEREAYDHELRRADLIELLTGTARTAHSVASARSNDRIPRFAIWKVIVESLGNWRSWLARFLDMEEVTGSNPVLPTIFSLSARCSVPSVSLGFPPQMLST